MEMKMYKNGCPQAAMDVRVEVFVEEQGFHDEFDAIDDIAIHAVLFDGETPVGTARTFWDEASGTYHIGRVAVRKPWRGQHLGEQLMLACEDAIQKEGGKRVTLSSQVRAMGFYQTLGYTAYGEEYLDEHCPHRMMEKELGVRR